MELKVMMVVNGKIVRNMWGSGRDLFKTPPEKDIGGINENHKIFLGLCKFPAHTQIQNLRSKNVL